MQVIIIIEQPKLVDHNTSVSQTDRWTNNSPWQEYCTLHSITSHGKTI